jgi:flagellar biosynthesis GTPase FlhF
MENNQSNYRELLNRLKDVRRKEKSNKLLSGIFNSIAITTLVLLGVSAIELIANGDESFRGVLALIILLSLIGAGLYFVLPSVLYTLRFKGMRSLETLSIRIGKAYPEIKDRLCNVIQLMSAGPGIHGTSPEMAYAAFDGVAQQTRNKDFSVIIDNKELKKSAIFFLAGIIVTAGLLIGFDGSLGASLNRVMNWKKSFLPPAPFTLEIEPKYDQVLRNDEVTISVISKGEIPEEVRLYIKEEQQEEYDIFTLKQDSAGIFRYKIPTLKRTIKYYAEADWLNLTISTDHGDILVTDRPMVRSFSGTIHYPSYTKLAPKAFSEQNADITALTGSYARVNIISNKEIKSASIVFEAQQNSLSIDTSLSKVTPDTLIYDLTPDGKTAAGTFPIKRSGTYYIRVTDHEDQENDSPIRYNISALTDEYPSITMIQPVMDVQLTEDALLPIIVSISDDYGFSRLVLNYRLVASRYVMPEEKYSQIVIPMINDELTKNVGYMWDLNQLGISPEDHYEYYLEVFDNDVVSGPKSSRTSSLLLRLPSLEEVLSSANEQQDKIEEDLEKVLKKAEEVKKDMDGLNQEILKNQKQKELSWEEQKKTENILKKREDLQKKIEEIQKELEDVSQDLQQNNAISQETMDKYMELQQLLNEVNSPELERMNQMMRNAMEQMSPEEMQKTMENMKFDEERFRKSVERTINILKRLKAEQKTETLRKLAEKLAEKQKDLMEKMANTNPEDKQKREDLAREQERLKEDLANMEKEMQSLEDLMKEIGEDMPMDEFQKAEEALNSEQTNQEMMSSMQQMQKGDFKNAQNSQQKAMNNLQKFAQQMQQLQNQMNENVSKEAMRQMQKSINDMLELSEQQEDLKQDTKGANYNSTKLPEMAQKQSEIYENLANVAKGMMELSQKSFAVTPEMGKEIGDAMRQMQQSMEKLSERNPHQSAKSQEQAMSCMNKAAMSMQNQLSMMQQQNSGSCNNPGGMGQGQQGQQAGPGAGSGSFMQRLQQAAAQQQAINQAMQQQMGGGGKLSMEEQGKMSRIAGEQGKAMKSVQELAREEKQFSSGEKKALGSLEKIAEDMQQVMTDMESGRITPETLKRQERILSRLLDASRSMNERDFEKKRESNTGMDFYQESPAEIDMSTQEGREKMWRDFLKSIEQGYTKDYEDLIRSYFEQLQKNNAVEQ